MANVIDDKSSGLTFQWKIENISHCWLSIGGKIDSPKFIVDAQEGSKWFLRLYPSEFFESDNIALYLRRTKDSLGPNTIVVHYQIAVLDEEGRFLQERSKSNCNYSKGSSNGFDRYERWEKVFRTHKDSFLPKGTLTVQCTIWRTDQKPAKTKHLYAQTTFNVNRRNFMCRIEEFSSLKCGQKHAFKDSLLEITLDLEGRMDLEKKLVVLIKSIDESIKYFSFKASIVDAEEKNENCGTQECSLIDLKVGLSFDILLPKELMENGRYLPNDVLSLDCEYAYSDGSVSYEHCGYGKISPKFTNEWFQNQNREDFELVNDFQMMFNDSIFSDTEIRTSTKTFSAHKAVLSARSPVFRNMFTSDMKEKNTGHVNITDFEADTIHRMLLYMYTDSLENMKCEIASKVYAIADKYEILSLKIRCSSFLKKNLCPGNVCDALVLADLHNDDDLRDAAQNYIFTQDKEYFDSQDWEKFMKTHLVLAADVMHKKIFH